MTAYEDRQVARLKAEAVARFRAANPGVEPVVVAKINEATLCLEVTVRGASDDSS